MKTSFIGLGKMGTAMAGRLLGNGYELGVYNRTAGRCDPLVESGATRLASIADAAGFAPVVVTMVENDAALSAICTGDAGLVAALPAGAIHVAMGTHSQALISRLSGVHADAGSRFVCAPVLGRPPAAEAGQLGIIAAGPDDAIAQCQSLFALLGRRVYRAGIDPVAAAVAKIANNFMLAAAIEALGESFALARKSGLPADTFYEILTDGLFNAPAYKIYGRIIADQDYFGTPGFSAATGLKDVNLALAAGDAAGTPLPFANICRDRLIAVIANGHAEADWSVMAYEQARTSGLD